MAKYRPRGGTPASVRFKVLAAGLSARGFADQPSRAEATLADQ
jgi:hypothetical protein